MMVPKQWLDPLHAADMAPFTDASRELSTLSGGAGCVFVGNGAIQVQAQEFQFTKQEVTWLEICDLEGLVCVLWLKHLCETCPEQITGRRFWSWCDNRSFEGAVNAHKSNAPTLAFLVGLLHGLQAQYSFDFRLKYVRSEDNVAADALSRLDYLRFFSFMQEQGVQESDIVFVDVQETVRQEWSLKLRSMRTLAANT